MGRSTIVLLALLSPLLLEAQIPSAEAQALRAKAVEEGSVEVKVVTRALSASRGSVLTPERHAQIARDQSRIVMLLVARNLIVGNEITIEQDGAFTMRVLPEAVDRLAASTDVAEIHSVGGGLASK
jgi:limonene-1,2-epoxide hydrolase